MVEAMVNSTLPDKGYVRLEQIIGNRRKGIVGVIPISRATWYAGIKDGRFPPPEKRFGKRISVWNVKVIQELIDEAA